MRFTYSYRKMPKIFANSGDTDQTPHSVASDLGLHCLPIILLLGSRLQWVKVMVDKLTLALGCPWASCFHWLISISAMKTLIRLHGWVFIDHICQKVHLFSCFASYKTITMILGYVLCTLYLFPTTVMYLGLWCHRFGVYQWQGNLSHISWVYR